MADGYRVYWQPGCSSCLRAKEFLTTNGIPFASINVRATPGAMAELAALGAKSVPVVVKGGQFVFAQDLADLAAFVGAGHAPDTLPPADLVAKLDLILAASQRYLAQIPAERLASEFPGRNRSYLDVAYHIFVIPVAFLDAAGGDELTFDYFERRPPAGIERATDVIAYGDKVRATLSEWWRRTGEAGMPERVRTYYGEQSTVSVLERTAWHAAQHCRQLMAVLEGLGIEPDGPLGARELDGLPLPEHVYDDEVSLAPAGA